MPPRRKRESELQRPRSRKGGGAKDASKAFQGEEKFWPEPKAEWDQEVKDIYEAAMISGDEVFYEQSDIAMLRLILDDLSAIRSGGQRGSAEKYKALLAALQQMLLTETDRRKANIELQPRQDSEEDKPAHLVVMDDYRSGLGMGK